LIDLTATFEQIKEKIKHDENEFITAAIRLFNFHTSGTRHEMEGEICRFFSWQAEGIRQQTVFGI
jgi:hypothetical protein